MLLPRLPARSVLLRPASLSLPRNFNNAGQRRLIFSFLTKKRQVPSSQSGPLLAEDDLFHPFSKSPFPAVRQRGEAIKQLAPCPVCASSHTHIHAHTQAQPRAVKYECPDCGWPTHCSEEHWKEDTEHQKYCQRLREANEDEHDLRSGRRLHEFELPGPQEFEEAISFANWDVFWYTRGFNSMDTERSRRHASKLLTYPITIGSALHQFSNLTFNNQRLTPEGSRSLAALRSTLHVEPGAPETEEAAVGKPQVRVFVLGARAESALPPHVWEQLTMLFPSTHFHLFFIGPQVSLPKPPKNEASKPSTTPSSTSSSGSDSSLTITGMQANYADVHAQFQHTLDPYSDVFFMFSPGFGFPSPDSVDETGQPLLQIISPTEWGPVLPQLLVSKCTIFVTGFSPTDVERDVRSLSSAPRVAGEFEWVITPGPNSFGSEKWEIADFDPRVMVKTNWGIWAIRGKSRDIQEQSSIFKLFG
ncbi:Protein MSS51, mitochondrial [Leucoagaricus sp. SymC.cos]|nr:Protein MSS51, mitochondrial [Leucoagaricus sp. SymC.cos]